MNKLKLQQKHALVCSFLLVFLINSCSVQKPSGLTDQDREYLQNVYVDIADNWNKGNRKPYVDVCSETTFYMIPNHELISDLTAIKNYVYAFPETKMEFKAVEIWGNSDMANVRGVYGITDPQGNSLDKGKFINLWKKDAEGNWKVTHEIWNSDLALNAQ